MSKSTGNVISPFGIINEYKELAIYPEEVLRFMVTSEVSTFEDGDLTIDSMRAAYQSKLANGVGNLTSRVMKMATTNFTEAIKIEGEVLNNINIEVRASIENLCATYDHQRYMQSAWDNINALDEYISTNTPFKKVKSEDQSIKQEGLDNITHCVHELYKISELIKLVMPKTSKLIQELIINHKLPDTPIFNRLA
jgi:methionyl-tRNA synthetase